MLSLAEAARACGLSDSTLRRKRDQLRELGAAQTSKGWQIPVTALVSLGLMAPTTATPTTDVPGDGADSGPDTLTAELEALRLELVEAQRRAAVAEAVAAERERVIEAQAMALRMLEAGKTPTAPTGAVTPPSGPATPESSTPAASGLGMGKGTPSGGALQPSRWRRLFRRP